MEKGNGNKNGPSTNAHRYRFDGFEIDPANRLLVRDGIAVPLTGRIFDILLAFVENPGRLLEKDELLEKVWNAEFVEEGNLSRNISTLRKALGDNGKEHKYIATVQGHGYRFIADVVYTGDRVEQFEGGPDRSLGSINPGSSGDQTQYDQSRDGEREIPPAKRIGSQLYRRPWLISIGSICLIATVVIAFRLEGYKPRQIDILSVERLRRTKLTQEGDVYGGLISPDGQYLTYTKISGNEKALFVRQIATGSVLELQPPQKGRTYWAAAFAPDDSFLYYVVKEPDIDYGNLYRIPLFGGHPRKLAQFANGGLTVSPDGRKLAFTRIDRQAGTSSIVVVDEDGNNEKTISSTDLDSMFYSLEWSPDGNSFVYSFKRHDGDHSYWYLAEIPASGGSETVIGEPSDSTILMAKWLPDKSGLLVNAVDEATRQPQIYSVSYPDGAKRRITNDLNSYVGFSTTADARSIVLPQINSDRQIWNLDGGDSSNAVQISNGTEKHYDSVAWSQDEYLVFDEDENSSFDNFNIFRMRPDGTDLQQLTFGPGNNTEPTISPDGTSIAFVSNRSGKSQLWRMNIDGRDLTQLTDLTNDVMRPVFSPDGQKIYFSVSAAGKCNIWQVSAAGGDSSPVIDEDVYRWSVAPDNAHLAYSSYDKKEKRVETRIRSLQPDATESVLDISPETWMEWSPDGSAIYFNTAQDGARNIWRQPLDGSPALPVTNFSGEQIFRFAWAPNGKNLICIRHTTTFDAVLLHVG